VLAIVAKTPDRESQVDFSVPHTETFDAFFVRTGQPAIPNLAAAAGKEIVVRRSDAAVDLLTRKFPGKLTFVDTVPQGLALVAAGQHDAFLNSKLIGTLEMRENHIPGLTAGPPIPDYKRVFAFAVRKGDVELLEKLNQGLRIIKANGEYDRIYQQWLEVQPENRWQKMVPYLRWAIAAIVLLVVLAGGLQWLVRLRTRQLVRANETISAEVAERRKAEAALQQANATLEQRVAERTAELRQARGWLSVTLSSIGDAVLATDITGLVTFVNPVAAALTGWKPEEAEGQPIQKVFQILNEKTRIPAEDIVLRVLQEGHVVELANHTALITKDGREIPIEDSAAPIRDHSDNVVGVVLVFHDVTEKRRAEAALVRSEKLASVGRMAASIAHEINNPLEAVMSLLFLASENKELPEKVRQYLEMADGELKRVAHITRQSLGFYRESNAPALTSVNAVLDSAVDLLKSKITAKLAVIEKQWDGDLEVTAVPGELRQVFSNLLANSLDAIDEKGTIKLRVSSGGAFNNGQRCVRITVADNGKGISASSRSHLFEPLYTTKGTVGTGLGLWVSKQIVDKHGGTIRMHSRTDGARRGTAFSVVLPVALSAKALSQSAGA